MIPVNVISSLNTIYMDSRTVIVKRNRENFKFNRARRRNPARTSLTFSGSTISLEINVNYLGATLDDIFTAMTINSFKALYPLLHSRSNLSTTNKMTLYKTIIHPKMNYASLARLT